MVSLANLASIACSEALASAGKQGLDNSEYKEITQPMDKRNDEHKDDDNINYSLVFCHLLLTLSSPLLHL